jgi:ATP-binding cassette subfamily B (MDR/TAP) protein 1
LEAYAQSAGYAEQALSAIRVVTAFGQQTKEGKSYDKYLHRAKEAGNKVHFKIGLVMGGFFASMFGMYTYSFLLGAHWMRNQWTTLTLEDKPYTAGDVLCVFFGVLFGMFALGMAGPNFKAVSEGKVAGKMAFDIIDRKPAIPPNEGK